MRFKNIIKMFENGNVSVCGLRGRGKDMLMSNVAVRRKKPYISNIDYGGQYMPLNFELLNCGENKYIDFIEGDVKQYTFPYCEGADIYISDCGVYLPCQYNEQLNKRYAHMATFTALSRHLGQCNVHYNTQALNRVWDKFREQSDIYIRCESCKVFFKKIVLQKVTIYDKYQSAEDAVKPFRWSSALPFFAPREARANERAMAMMKKQDYENTHGMIKRRMLLYVNRSTYDTRRFKSMLENGKKVVNDAEIKKISR